MTDLDAAAALFGAVTADLGFFQVLGAVGLVLVALRVMRYWGVG
jgi:hypothetical protein